MFPTCPNCGSTLKYTQIRYNKSFNCAVCDQLLFVPRGHVQWLIWRALLASTVALFLYGLRGYALLLGAFLGWLPMLVLDMVLIRPLYPSPIRVDRGENRKSLTLDIRN